MSRRVPWITLATVTAGALTTLLPSAGEALEYERSAVASGAYLRLLTGQLTHWTPRMAAADLGVVLAAGVWIELRCRRLVVATLAGGAAAVALGLHFLLPDLSRYRGASGLASALFVVAALDLLTRLPGLRSRGLAGLALGLFALKLGWEQVTGTSLVPALLPPGVALVPLVHLLGALAGGLAFVAVPVGSVARRPG